MADAGRSQEGSASRERSPRAVVFGATGFTGGLIAEELADRGVPLVLGGRNREGLARLSDRLGGIPTLVADARSPHGLTEHLADGDVLVNCVGPFTDLGDPVVRAALSAGAHYLDTTGEQGFMARVRRRHDGDFRAAGRVAVNGMAFEYALGDCAAALACRRLDARPERVRLVYGWRGSSSATSAGTRRSALRMLAAGGLAYRDGSWQPEAAGARSRRVRLPDGSERPAVSFPSGEVLTVPRHQPVRSVQAWFVVGKWTARLFPPLAPAVPTLARPLLPLLDRLSRLGPTAPAPEERRASRVEIVVDAESAEGRSRVVVRARDPYGLTAAIAALAARSLIRGARRPGPEAGVLAPAQLVEPRELLEALEGPNLALEVQGG